MCGETDVDLHHKTYERIGSELLTDLEPLCRPCHNALHVLEYRRQATLDSATLKSDERAAEYKVKQTARKERATREVAEARAEGFFSCDGTAGRFTHCFAAAVYDEDRQCAATLCLLTPREEGLKDHRRYKQTLIDAARQMTVRIGGEWPSVVRG